jgi:8-oxo-dGTP diphosphatase
MAQIGAWGAPGRDPRGRNVSVAFLAVVPPGGTRADAGDDAAEAAWFGVDDLPELAFDHADILSAGLRKLRLLALSTHAVFGLLPDRFSLADLRRTLAAVRGAPVTVQQTAALAGCARLAVESEEEGRATYRCTVEELTTPLSQ